MCPTNLVDVLVGLGTDEQTPIVDAIVAHLGQRGDEVVRIALGCDWPEVGRLVGEAVCASQIDRGVVCCHTGTGVSIAANKIPGVRAALCTDVATAIGARRWNDANVLALGLSVVSEASVRDILEAFLTTPPDASSLSEVARVEPHLEP